MWACLIACFHVMRLNLLQGSILKHWAKERIPETKIQINTSQFQWNLE